MISDVRRILTFCYYRTGISLENIILLTDLKPNKFTVQSINLQLQEKAQRHLKKKGIEAEINTKLKFGVWLKSYNLDMILENSLLTNDNILEYAYLLTNYICINGLESFKENFQENIIGSKDLLIYFSCHGISSQKNVSMLIPSSNNDLGTETFHYKDFRLFFNKELIGINTIILFDCCYSEKFCPEINENILFIGSTLKNQTCGFYGMRDSKQMIGSLFTHYLLKELRTINSDAMIEELLEKIDKEIIKYRRKKYKTDQNIYWKSIKSQFPDWLFTFSPKIIWSN
jgi:hypothetical protein